MCELRAAGCGWTEIANTLKAEKRKNRRGDYDRWTPAQVYNILKVTPLLNADKYEQTLTGA
jgi:hypothetical protein